MLGGGSPSTGVGLPAIGKLVVILLFFVALAFALLWHKRVRLDVYKTVDELVFVDRVLEECVDYLARTNGWDDVGHFSSLRCNHPSGDGIETLDGIEHLVELTDVNLAFNRITDIDPLAELTHLAALNLSHNEINRVPTLNSATSLKRIDLNDNRLMSVQWLSTQRFAVLDSLALAHNQISDFSPLSSLIDLGELNVRGNHISDIEPILSLGSLVLLDAGGNSIANISSIGRLSDLQRLYLDSNRLSSLTGLASLQQLEELDLANNALQSIAEISRLYRLQRLNLSRTGITSLAEILALGDIEMLQVTGNPDLACATIADAVREYGDEAIKRDKNCAISVGQTQGNASWTGRLTAER